VDDGLVAAIKPVTLAWKIGAIPFMQTQNLAEKLLFRLHQRRRGLDVDVVKIQSVLPDP
jgi:hypothetical protein